MGGKKDVPYFSENCNNQNDPYRETNDPYRNMNEWEETSRNEWEMPKSKGKGQEMKGDQMFKTDPAEEIYEKSTRSIKTSERSVGGAMPLLSEFARFANWETEAKRWKNRLYNRPVSHIIEYFIINFKNSVQTVGRTES